jgi:hypothetical protein
MIGEKVWIAEESAESEEKGPPGRSRYRRKNINADLRENKILECGLDSSGSAYRLSGSIKTINSLTSSATISV